MNTTKNISASTKNRKKQYFSLLLLSKVLFSGLEMCSGNEHVQVFDKKNRAQRCNTIFAV